jgi:hypothetical protein
MAQVGSPKKICEYMNLIEHRNNNVEKNLFFFEKFGFQSNARLSDETTRRRHRDLPYDPATAKAIEQHQRHDSFLSTVRNDRV